MLTEKYEIKNLMLYYSFNLFVEYQTSCRIFIILTFYFTIITSALS